MDIEYRINDAAQKMEKLKRNLLERDQAKYLDVMEVYNAMLEIGMLHTTLEDLYSDVEKLYLEKATHHYLEPCVKDKIIECMDKTSYKNENTNKTFTVPLDINGITIKYRNNIIEVNGTLEKNFKTYKFIDTYQRIKDELHYKRSSEFN